ncbi:MAG: HU family DNA-binding protein [Paracoccaceae bacterium]|nr:HU family DNA-binding protein [Paracoccaceae bacterium]MDE2914356.1 HU family DNA-binding protein [Paracoccaceae bacterium]
MAKTTMTKAGLAQALAAETGVSAASARDSINALIGIITDELYDGGSVTIPGFAKFYVQERPEREARNPFNGTTFVKPADRVVRVKLSKSLSDALD